MAPSTLSSAAWSAIAAPAPPPRVNDAGGLDGAVLRHAHERRPQPVLGDERVDGGDGQQVGEVGTELSGAREQGSTAPVLVGEGLRRAGDTACEHRAACLRVLRHVCGANRSGAAVGGTFWSGLSATVGAAVACAGAAVSAAVARAGAAVGRTLGTGLRAAVGTAVACSGAAVGTAVAGRDFLFVQHE